MSDGLEKLTNTAKTPEERAIEQIRKIIRKRTPDGSVITGQAANTAWTEICEKMQEFGGAKWQNLVQSKTK